MAGDDGRAKGIELNRRQALSAAGVAAGALATPAWAAPGVAANDPRLRTFEGRYAAGGRIVDGYFASPRGRNDLDVLVVIPGEGGVDDALRETVRRHALGGVIAFAPDLAGTSGLTGAGREAMVAATVAKAAWLKRHGRGNGIVRVVAA